MPDFQTSEREMSDDGGVRAVRRVLGVEEIVLAGRRVSSEVVRESMALFARVAFATANTLGLGYSWGSLGHAS